MTILLTGASSKIGKKLLVKLLEKFSAESIVVLTRQEPDRCLESFRALPIDLARIRPLRCDLAGDLEAARSLKVDLCIHLAAVTHTKSAELYDQVNHQATARLAQMLFENGCRRFCYFSSQTAHPEAGGYAASKFAAEGALSRLEWEQLLILRPSEVVGLGGSEGIDQVVRLARTKHLVPWFLNFSEISFAPVDGDTLVRVTIDELENPRRVKILTVRGQPFSATRLAFHLARRFAAVPLPVPIPLLAAVGRFLKIAPDQVKRLTGERGVSPLPEVPVEVLTTDFDFLKN